MNIKALDYEIPSYSYYTTLVVLQGFRFCECNIYVTELSTAALIPKIHQSFKKLHKH